MVKARPAIGLAADGAAGVESEPAEPEQARAEQRERHVVRQDRLPREILPRSDHDRRDERGNAGVHVHDRAACEIERAQLRQPAAAPDPVGDRTVDDDRPQGDEQRVGGEAHPLDDGARDERGRDDRERPLVGHEEHLRDQRGGALGSETDVAQERLRQIADVIVAGREGEREHDERPGHADEAQRDVAHHHRVERILRADEAAVEEPECRRHQQHERRRDEHPRRVRLVHGWCGSVLRMGQRRRERGDERGQASDADRGELASAERITFHASPRPVMGRSRNERQRTSTNARA